jgi:hypothetical protein
MAGTFKNKAESPHDYVLERALITSPQFVDGASIDIKNVITDIEIFEHLDKPYLTGNIILVDDNNIYNNVNFSGSEKISLKFSLLDPDSTPIEKDFIIEKTIKNARANDKQSALVFHIVEQHAFDSTIINVNKAYSGKPVEIIQSIITDNLGKTFSSPIVLDTQEPIKVLIPNLTPLEAATWIRDRATTIDGAPFYFFSTLANNNLHIIPLDDMLATPPDPKPYVYSQITTSIASSRSIDDQAYLIQEFKSKSNDNIISLVRMGYVGSQNYFYNPITGTPVSNVGSFFNLAEVLNTLKNKDVIRSNQNQFGYASNYEINGISFSQVRSKIRTDITPTNTYVDINNYSEAANVGKHKLKIISEALRELIVRNSIDIALPGRNFLNGRYSNTIGNQIKLRFLATSTATNTNVEQIDTKKSGDYLMYAVKHHFKKERYDVIASCVKLADLNEEPIE